jgi:hypothetical protein
LTHGLTTARTALLERLAQGIQKHPRRITAFVAAVLLTGGGGAFAVASLGPDPADLPVRLVELPVESLASGVALADLTDTGGFSLYRSEQVRSTDTAESLLQRMGVADPLAAAFLRRDTLVQRNLLGRTGRLVSAETSDDHSLQRLTARWAHDDSGNFKRLVVEKTAQGFVAHRDGAADGLHTAWQGAPSTARCLRRPTRPTFQTRGRATGRVVLG